MDELCARPVLDDMGEPASRLRIDGAPLGEAVWGNALAGDELDEVVRPCGDSPNEEDHRSIVANRPGTEEEADGMWPPVEWAQAAPIPSVLDSLERFLGRRPKEAA